MVPMQTLWGDFTRAVPTTACIPRLGVRIGDAGGQDGGKDGGGQEFCRLRIERAGQPYIYLYTYLSS